MAISRRTALRASFLGGTGAALVGAGGGTALADPADSAPGATDAATALRLLKDGNRRWRRFASRHPHESRARREEVAGGQHPFAIILSCADSRVPPELVFDQGLGDLFTIRAAGEVLDESVLGSICYGAQHLHVPLVVVLGHSSCGAVTAAVDVHDGGEAPHGHIGYLVERILPVVDATPDEGDGFVDACISANARHVAEELRADADLRGLVDSGKLKIVAARYELDTYQVNFLD
ncbi:carbonic anhydrase [Marinitenerispora sediminis]|uniref:carbonic anhydrase n=1 Tax=Marinitenerispora sediminis TaxID=1931232 RepID=A0A368SYM6_9ACTN|nr:carbonic anhydrase [Marinitenerispora sediminis]RCV47627.1 carbonic anhydrase [Marinitenerispora sediminis]RCV47984.1 carbonic anhydrase [Marinitenerispora sediminis]RCV49305.1 carbonic anhydrase [Marinitenerispora sediminis]